MILITAVARYESNRNYSFVPATLLAPILRYEVGILPTQLEARDLQKAEVRKGNRRRKGNRIGI